MVAVTERFSPRLLQLSIAIGLIVIGLVMWGGTRPTWLTLAVVSFLLMGWHTYAELPKLGQRLFLVATLLIIILFIPPTTQGITRNLQTHEDGDFKGFWISARVGLARGDLYDPAQYYAVAEEMAPRDLNDAFRARYLDTTFWYPPPTILIFLPLGLFDLHTAWIVNYFFMTGLFIVLIWLLKDTLFPRSGLPALLVIAALLVVCYPTRLVFQHSQTNFLLLILLVLLWRSPNRPRAGIWLALAALIKPLVAAVALWPLLQRHWRTLVYGALTGIGLLALTAVIYGPATLLRYSPTSKLPLEVYTESINQGLLATILRTTDSVPLAPAQSPLFNPLFIATALLLTLITAWLLVRLPDAAARWGLALLIPYAMLIYPTTLHHYGIFLILPLLQIWAERHKLISGTSGALIFITFVFTLLSYQSGAQVFGATLICWLVVAAICWARTQHRPAGQATATARATSANTLA